VTAPPSCFPDGIPPKLKDVENVFCMYLYITKVSEFAIGQGVVNRVKLRVDTLGRQFHAIKTETIRSQTGESKLTKTKTGTAKSSLYSISYGVRGESSANYFEVDDVIT
jgi:hypothetical protein